MPRIMLWLGVLLLLVVGIFLIVANVKMYVRRQELNAEVKFLQHKIEATKQENEKLEKGIFEVNNDQYIEKVAREELDLQKPGEKVVSFVQPQNQETKPAAPKNFLQSWLSWISGWFKK